MKGCSPISELGNRELCFPNELPAFAGMTGSKGMWGNGDRWLKLVPWLGGRVDTGVPLSGHESPRGMAWSFGVSA